MPSELAVLDLALVTAVVDDGVPAQLVEPVLARDLPDRAALAAHDDRVRLHSVGCVVDAPQQLAVGDPGRAEEDVVTGDEVLGGEDAVEIVSGVDRLIRNGNVSAFFAPVADETFLSSGSRSLVLKISHVSLIFFSFKNIDLNYTK